MVTFAHDGKSSNNTPGRIPQIVAFSGIDGAGKTTQIDRLCSYLQTRGYRVGRLSFWDDVAFMSKTRARASFTVFRTQGAPQHSALRHDKNVHTWYLTLVRAVFYFLDALRLRTIVTRVRGGNCDFVVFDRYLYDQLAQLRSRGWLARAYIRVLVRLAPQPEVAFVLDAFPDEAFSRKPEYPLEFMHDYRQAFLELPGFIPQIVVISPSTVDDVSHRILRSLSESTGSNVFAPSPVPG